MLIKRLAAFLTWSFASYSYATDILLTWETPTDREDGSKIQSIDRFNLYQTTNNVLQDVIEVPGDATGFQLSEVEAGSYTFQISTVEAGLEGAPSDPVTVNVDQAKPVKIKLIIQVVE